MQLLTSLLSGDLTALIAIGGVIVAAVGALWGARRSGAKSERAKQERARRAAMSEAQAIEQEVAGNTPETNRDKLKMWGKK